MWACVTEVAALRRDAVSFADAVLVRRASRNIVTPGAWAQVEYRYWACLFDDVEYAWYYLYIDRRVEYTRNGKLHRTDGPALEFPRGCKEWWINGMRHRSNGPAIETCYGVKYWCIDGKPLRTEEAMAQYM